MGKYENESAEYPKGGARVIFRRLIFIFHGISCCKLQHRNSQLPNNYHSNSQFVAITTRWICLLLSGIMTRGINWSSWATYQRRSSRSKVQQLSSKSYLISHGSLQHSACILVDFQSQCTRVFNWAIRGEYAQQSWANSAKLSIGPVLLSPYFLILPS